MKIKSCLLWASTALCTLPAHAQDNLGETVFLDQIIVTANRSESSISTVAQSVIVVEQEEIERLRITSSDTADLVAKVVPGYAPSNQTISGASESFRGRSVLIMVDGVPRNTPLRNNTRILSLIDMNNIERIEVVNGASSLYGAGATGGTINIITKRGSGEGPQFSARVEGKAFTADFLESVAPNVNLTMQGVTGGFDYFLSATGDFSRKTYDGNGNEMASDAMLGQGGGDRLSEGNLYGVLGYETGSKRFEASIDLNYLEQNPDWFTDLSTHMVSPNYSDPYTGKPLKEDSKYLAAKFSESEFVIGSLEVKAFYNDVEKQSPFSKYDATYNNQVYYSGDPANPTSPYNQTIFNSQKAGVTATVDSPLEFLIPGAHLTWGADYTFERVEQTMTNDQDVISPMTQNQIALFGQAEVPVTDRFRVQGGVRFDQFYLDVDDFRRPYAYVTGLALPDIAVIGGNFDYNAWTFNAGAVFDITDETQVFGNFSQGYSLTDIGGFTRRAGLNTVSDACDAYGWLLNALYGCTNAPDFTVNYSDIAPDPQLVNTFEAGLRGDWGRVRGNFSAYYSTSENGLTYDISSNRVSQQKEQLWGAEFTGEFDATDMLTVGGILAYAEGRYDTDDDGDTDTYLPNNRIPTTFKGTVYGNMILPYDILAHAEVEFFSGRDREQGEKLKGAALLNLSLAKEFDNGGKLAFGVRNLLDTDYVNPTATATRDANVPGLGRTIALSYQVKF
ncbi:TonB-dependent receptor [Roseibium sp.]|uniref:TonB-dependent receptor n=1 Tax=Roseibium sp. TaxID=1936156 RepID=UPI003A96A7C1